jgi:flagellar motor switch protein FliN
MSETNQTPEDAHAAATHQVDQSRIDVILDIDLPVVVRFGRTDLPLRTLTRLGPGSVIDLGRSPDEPVELMVSNRVVARGEVVIVGGNYGIRILDVVSPSERMPWVEA